MDGEEDRDRRSLEVLADSLCAAGVDFERFLLAHNRWLLPGPESILSFFDVVLVINHIDEFLGFLDPAVVIQVPRSFEGEDLQENEALEGDDDEDVFGNPEPLSGLGVREFG